MSRLHLADTVDIAEISFYGHALKPPYHPSIPRGGRAMSGDHLSVLVVARPYTNRGLLAIVGRQLARIFWDSLIFYGAVCAAQPDLIRQRLERSETWSGYADRGIGELSDWLRENERG